MKSAAAVERVMWRVLPDLEKGTASTRRSRSTFPHVSEDLAFPRVGERKQAEGRGVGMTDVFERAHQASRLISKEVAFPERDIPVPETPRQGE